MPDLERPPHGVMPFNFWLQGFEDWPDLQAWVDRYVAVSEAIERYRAKGLEPSPFWLQEVLGRMEPCSRRFV